MSNFSIKLHSICEMQDGKKYRIVDISSSFITLIEMDTSKFTIFSAGTNTLYFKILEGDVKLTDPDSDVVVDMDFLSGEQKEKVEFLCNECCWVGCRERKACYENVSRRNLGEDCGEHVCASPTAGRGYRFSDAMKNPGFISKEEIREVYLPRGFSHFKIEGRGLGSAVVLEFLLYYMTRPEHQLKVREEIYLDSALDLF